MKNPFHGGGMDIFWNCTLHISSFFLSDKSVAFTLARGSQVMRYASSIVEEKRLRKEGDNRARTRIPKWWESAENETNLSNTAQYFAIKIAQRGRNNLGKVLELGVPYSH